MSAPVPSENPAFKPVRLRHVMREVRRPLLPKTGVVYREIGVRSHGRGVFHKEATSAEILGNKRVFWLKPGTLVFNIVFAWERAVAVLSEAEAGMIGSHRFPTYEMVPGRAHAGFMKHYFTTGYGHYLLRLNSPGAAGRNKTLSQSSLMKEDVWLPPADAQNAIADFLDRKTAAIDALIEKKQKLLELLVEKRAALINQAVTKGLDPNVPTADSGLDWLGELPAHWRALPLRHLISGIEQGWSPVAAARPAEDGEWAVLKLSAVTGGVWDWTAHKALDEPPTASNARYRVRKGDLLVTRANTRALVADAVVVAEDPPVPVIMSDLIYRLRVSASALDPQYAAMLLRSPIGRLQVGRDARGTSMSMAKVSQGQIRAWIVPLPDLAEQKHIVKAVGARVAGIRRLEAGAERSIRKLGEYRAALITAAVTGQLDVTKAA